MRAVGRDVVFGIGLAGEHRAVFGVHIFAADEEVAGLGDRQGSDAVRARGREHRSGAGEDEKSRGEAADPFEEAGDRQEFARGGLHRFAPMSRTVKPQLWTRHARKQTAPRVHFARRAGAVRRPHERSDMRERRRGGEGGPGYRSAHPGYLLIPPYACFRADQSLAPTSVKRKPAGVFVKTKMCWPQKMK